MCETFHMEFSNETGIVAWANEEIYEQFAGPAMRDDDFWKIYLVELESHDIDGSDYLLGFLEEVLLYPMRPPNGPCGGQYETVEESPGIWATRPRREVIDVDQDRTNGGQHNADLMAHIAEDDPNIYHEPWYDSEDMETDKDDEEMVRFVRDSFVRVGIAVYRGVLAFRPAVDRLVICIVRVQVRQPGDVRNLIVVVFVSARLHLFQLVLLVTVKF
jgi:hypothetical protein